MRETFEKDPIHVSDLYGPRISEWRDRELQLSRLHEEIVGKRESHLNYSLAYAQNRAKRLQTNQLVDIEKSRQRNEKYLQDVMLISENLRVDESNPVSPRLATLQSNYWAMVKSLKPLWEENLQPTNLRSSRTELRGTPRAESLNSARGQQTGAGAIPGSARSQKSTSVNFRATELNIAKQTVQKPERKSISKKNKTK